MEHDSLIEVFKEDLSLLDCDETSLLNTVVQLEARLVEKYGCREDSNQALWIRLIQLSIEMQNLKLAKVILHKLKLSHLFDTISYITGNHQCKTTTFSLLASYFKLQPDCEKPKQTMCLATSRNRIVENFNTAKQLELDEEFIEALEVHERCSTQLGHCGRLILKNSLHISLDQIRKYLSKSDQSKAVLAELVWLLGDNSSALELYKSINDRVNATRLTADMFGLNLSERYVLEGLDRLSATDLGSSNSFTDLKSKMRSLIKFTSSVDKPSRKALFELATIYHSMGDLIKASTFYLYLGLTDQALRFPNKRLHTSKLLQFMWRDYCGPSRALYALVDDLNTESYSMGEKDKKHYLYLKLGMIDEVLQSICSLESGDSLAYSLHVIDNLKLLVRKRDLESYNNLDINLNKSTLRKVSIILADEKTLNTNVITIFILCTSILLIKIDLMVRDILDVDLSMLETIFEYLSKLSKELKFNATEWLTSAANSLIGLVKEKLELINESITIRESFKALIDAICDECMVESQYKSAAMLYTSIEDNIKAVKALMRTGQVEVVINFSLLVKDIAVNRITINYLRHCRVDQSVIDEFTARSRK